MDRREFMKLSSLAAGAALTGCATGRRTAFVPDDPMYNDRSVAQRAVGSAFFEAGCRLIKYNPEYLFSGINPID